MKSKSRKGKIWILWTIIGLMIALTLLLDFLVPFNSLLDFFIRGAAMLAYQLVFLSILMSAYSGKMMKIFGRSFIDVHHIATLSGLFLMISHPIGVAFRAKTVTVFMPALDSLDMFLRLGGRQALYLFLIAAVAAFIRMNIRRVWRILHTLTYLAFLFASIHGLLIGPNFVFTAVRVAAVIMMFVTVVVFLKRRLPANLFQRG